jgi:hypothetical protein
LSIYIASRKLKIDASVEVTFLNSTTIQAVTANDIFISQGTVRDDLMLKILIDKGILPFVVTYTKASKLSVLLTNLSLFIHKKIEKITPLLIEQSITLQQNISNFNTFSQTLLEEEEALQILESLSYYQQIQLFNFSKQTQKSKDTPSQEKLRNIYIDKKKSLHGVSKIYAILQDDSGLRVLKLKGKKQEDEEEFLRNKINNNFESLMRGEEISFKNRKFSFEYKEITQKYKEDFLLFGIEDIKDFQSYELYNEASKKEFNLMGLYEVDKEVKNLNEQGVLALNSLKNLLNNKEDEILNLDTFLLSTQSFSKTISAIQHKYQEHFKKTIISDMLSKIYDNIFEDNYKKSNLRYALLLLKNQTLEKINPKIQAHIFYDIQKGINLNALILQEHIGSVKKNDFNQERVEEEVEIDSKESEIENFLENNDTRRFIKLFLNTLLAMDSEREIEMEKIVRFVALFLYLAFDKELKATKKNGEEKFQIDHCYMMLVDYKIEVDRNNFFEYLDYFINEEIYPKSIEAHLQKIIAYQCSNNSKEITLLIDNQKCRETKENLRQKNSIFSKKLMVVGLFYKSITQEEKLEEIISTLFKKIRTQSISISEHCQKKISFKFLSYFFQGHGKKNCHVNLKDFFDQAKHFLEES